MTRYGRWPLVMALLAVTIAGLWLGRRQLSDAVVANWFADQQIQARYHVAAISPDSAVLDDVSIGPADRPDFTARRVIVALGWSPLWPRVDLVTLVSPRLRVKVDAGGASFGSLDRLLPGPDDPPRPFPDLDLRILGGRMDLATPTGAMTAAVSGHGGLRGGFVGKAVFDPAVLTVAEYHFAVSSAEASLVIERDATHLSSRFAMPWLTGPGQASARGIDGRFTATLPPALDRYAARLDANVGSGAAAGYAVGPTRLWIESAAGSLASPASGRFGMAAKAASMVAASQKGSAKQVVATGSYALGKTLAAASLDSQVTITGGSVALPLPALRNQARQMTGTLAQPLLASLAGNLAGAAKAFDAKARLVLPASVGPDRHLVLSGLRLRSASGASVVQGGAIELATTAIAMSGRLALSGGGLPSATVAGKGGWHSGRFDGGMTLVLGRWAAGGGATIDAATLVAKGSEDAARLDGKVRVSGALGGGVTANGLMVPLAISWARDGRIIVGDRCLSIDWQSLASADVRIDGGNMAACPLGGAIAVIGEHSLGGGVQLAPLALRGAVGRSALALSSGPVRVSLAGDIGHPGLTLAPVTVAGTLGTRRFHASLGGRFDASAFTGLLRIANAGVEGDDLPVTVADGGATLALASGRVTVSAGSVRLSDAIAPARFQPLRIAGVTATIAAGRAVIDGNARLEGGSTRLFGFTARHDLASGRGMATLETGNVVFGPALQPYQITESLRGVVENVTGTITGNGRFEWTRAGLTSNGALRIEKVDLSTAALGPVTGIDGALVFDDLVALTTPAGQILKVARINPGVVVDDGVVVFRLLGPDAVAIDSIRWPYAGGSLTLAPVTIRVADKSRSFRMIADNLDAEQFLQRFEIKNLNVTGRFDGILPLVFANGQGSIVGGHLQARSGGGLVQYVGEIGGENIGASARLAFDALRRLRYRNLGLDLDGDLDAELVTQLHFDGINEASTRLGAAVPIKATGLPFKFNVTVRAPFRALLGTAASFSDVRPLLHNQRDGVQPR